MSIERFVAAQDGVYERALGEIAAGSKRSHWMWFVFPQIAGLAHSATAQHHAIADPAVFERVLERFYDGPDTRTLELLGDR